MIESESYVVKRNNNISYYKKGTRERHRIDGPAYITNRCVQYIVNGYLHREDGPAEVWVKKIFYHFGGCMITENDFYKKVSK